MVRREAPELYRAVVNTVGELRGDRYFEDWTYQDVIFFKHKNSWIYAQTAPSLESTASVSRLADGGIFGTLGEVYGSAVLRERFSRLRNMHFMDEHQYKSFNEGKLPDGLVFEIRGEKIIIHHIMESKMGATGYSNEQAHGYLSTWKSRQGIRVEYREAGKLVRKTFSHKDIIIVADEGELEVRDVTLAELKQATILVGTELASETFQDEALELPFNTKEAREICRAFARELIGDRPHDADPVAISPEKPIPMSDEQFREAIEFWMYTHKRWPRMNKQDPFEHQLRKEMSKRGGQMTIYLEYFDGPLRYYLAKHNRSNPAIGPFQNYLLRSHPSPRAISALRAYIRIYEEPTGPIKIVAMLKQVNAEWRLYLDGLDEALLRKEDPMEVAGCQARLAAMSGREK